MTLWHLDEAALKFPMKWIAGVPRVAVARVLPLAQQTLDGGQAAHMYVHDPNIMEDGEAELGGSASEAFMAELFFTSSAGMNVIAVQSAVITERFASTANPSSPAILTGSSIAFFTHSNIFADNTEDFTFAGDTVSVFITATKSVSIVDCHKLAKPCLWLQR